MKCKISIDYDGTLHLKDVHEFIKNLDVDIYIVTSRFDDELSKTKHFINNDDLWQTVYELNLDDDKIIFTNNQYKYTYLKDKDFILHLDDCKIELDLIQKYTNTIPVLVDKNYQTNILKILKEWITKN